MRILITTLVLLVVGGCAGSTPGTADRLCAGNLYDTCQQEHDCEAANPDCHNFISAGIQVCSKTCTVGDDASCGMTFEGDKATCVAGVCTPPAANNCMSPR